MVLKVLPNQGSPPTVLVFEDIVVRSIQHYSTLSPKSLKVAAEPAVGLRLILASRPSKVGFPLKNLSPGWLNSIPKSSIAIA